MKNGKFQVVIVEKTKIIMFGKGTQISTVSFLYNDNKIEYLNFYEWYFQEQALSTKLENM